VIAWLPGRWPLVNDALSMIRAAGYYDGYGEAKVGMGAWVRRARASGADRWAQAVSDGRSRVAAVCRSCPRPAWPMSDVAVWIVGHSRSDPDAWTLAAKIIVDGLVDAGMLPCDRRGVGIVRGRCWSGDEPVWPSELRPYRNEIGALIDLSPAVLA